jgi:hypothetical protein
MSELRVRHAHCGDTHIANWHDIGVTACIAYAKAAGSRGMCLSRLNPGYPVKRALSVATKT